MPPPKCKAGKRGWGEREEECRGETVRGGGKSPLCWVCSVPRPYKVSPLRRSHKLTEVTKAVEGKESGAGKRQIPRPAVTELRWI